jgi:hypothetical protein
MKKVMTIAKSFIVWAILFVAVADAIAQSSGEIPIPLSDPARRGKLKAHLNSGSIKVRGTGRKDVLVKYSSMKEEEENKHDKNTRDGLKRISGGTLDLEVSENGNVVKAESDSWSNQVNLEIEVPSGFDVDIKTYNDGDLAVEGIQGEVVITNYNGEISAMNISGSVVASTYNGEIKVAFDKVTEGTPMSFSTYNGDIDLTFPAGLKASLKMKTEQGEILSGFDMNLIKGGPVTRTDAKSGTYKVKIDEWVKGDVNGGGAEFTMKNYNGDIIVRKK